MASTCSGSGHGNSTSTSTITISETESATPLYLNSEKWRLSNKEGSPSTQKRCAFARKCARLVKEQRARFYIMRRCVIMLICWHHYNDSS